MDEECVCDEGLLTSQNLDGLTASCDKSIEEFAENTILNKPRRPFSNHAEAITHYAGDPVCTW